MNPVEPIVVRVAIHTASSWCAYCGGPNDVTGALYASIGQTHRLCSPCGAKPLSVLSARLDAKAAA